MWAFISPCAFSNAALQMQAFNAWQSPNILAHKWGGGGGPPWGEFNGIGYLGALRSLLEVHVFFNWPFLVCFVPKTVYGTKFFELFAKVFRIFRPRGNFFDGPNFFAKFS